MILTTHIVLALASLIVATAAMLFPSKNILRTTYLMTTGGIISGIILGITSHTNLAQACISGSIYLSFIIASSFVTHYRIAKV